MLFLTKLLKLIPLLKWLGPAAIIAFFTSFGWSFVDNYRNMSGEIANLKRDLSLRDGREASQRRQIDRRDAAIRASKCKDQIEKWVKNPENIPVPFNPFNQLNNLGQTYRP